MDFDPNVLVLGPGGIKGFLQIGAVMALDHYKPGWRKNLSTISGVSIGSIIGLYIVCDLSMNDLVLDSLNIDLFKDLSNLSIKEFLSKQNVVSKQGLLSNEPIKNQISDRIRNKFGYIPTFKQLYMSTGIEYMVVTVNLNTGVEYINHKNFPDLSVVDGILRSINIPGAFHQIKEGKDIYIDGAFGNPYPIDQYDQSDNKILGIVNKTITINNSEDETEDGIISLLKYFSRSINSSMGITRDRNIENASHRCRHLIIEWPSVFDPLGLTITRELKAEMLIHGYDIGKKYLGIVSIEKEKID